MLRIKIYKLAVITALFFFTPNLVAENSENEKLLKLADEYFDVYKNSYGPVLYFYGLQPENGVVNFMANSAEDELNQRDQFDSIAKKLNGIDVNKLRGDRARVYHAKITESVAAQRKSQVCNSRLWSVNHLTGPNVVLNILQERMLVDTPVQRDNALTLWSDAADFYTQEIENLKEGLALGYSAPKSVVLRVVQQHEKLLTSKAATHPFMAAAERSNEKGFIKQFEAVLGEKVLPAMAEYKTFLAEEYLPKARDSRALSSIPKGRECYQALYRVHTTLDRTPEEVHEIGHQAVEAQKKQVVEFGKASLKSRTFSETIRKVKEDSAEKFASSNELHDFYEAVVERSKQVVPEYFHAMPEIGLVVFPVEKNLQGNSFSASYYPGTDDSDAQFRYDPSAYGDTTKGSAEIVALHEGFPGHHLQIGLSHGNEIFHPTERLFVNGAYAEGWGRYSEVLSEELGLIKTVSAKILRRAWPARGMVADTGLHVLGWSDKRVTEYLRESGSSYAVDIEGLLDRMAVIPAQLTAYDSGALKILELREQFRQSQGKEYDLTDFHYRVLKNGSVPMALLRKQVME